MYISFLTTDTDFDHPLDVLGDYPNGDIDVQLKDSGLRIPRYLVTTPIQVCPECKRAMVERKVHGHGIIVECPLHAQHQARGHFKLAINPALNRADRRNHTRQGMKWRRSCLRD